jgi:hypothetical protein
MLDKGSLGIIVRVSGAVYQPLDVDPANTWDIVELQYQPGNRGELNIINDFENNFRAALERRKTIY